MKNNKKIKKVKEFGNEEMGEDATQYGEFISSYFGWMTLRRQKENANRLENITKEEKE